MSEKLTALERFGRDIAQDSTAYPWGEGTIMPDPHMTGIPLTQYRLAADCVAFVREQGRFTADPNPYPDVIDAAREYDRLNKRGKTLAARIEEAGA